MKKHRSNPYTERRILSVLVLVLCVFLTEKGNASQNETQMSDFSKKENECVFIQNKGQIVDDKGMVRNDVLYYMRTAELDLYITRKGLSYVYKDYDNLKKNNFESRPFKTEIKKYRMDMDLIGSFEGMDVFAEEETPYYFNYYLSHCPQGITNVRAFSRVILKDVYEDIDMVIYNSSLKGIKYDFIVHPGADVNKIKFCYKGGNDLSQSNDGSITVNNPFGKLQEQSPVSFLKTDSKILDDVASKFKIDREVISFDIENYDKSKTLVIDPNIIWATFLGGKEADHIYAISIGLENRILVTGNTVSSDFPISSGAVQKELQGDYDLFISQYSYDGALLWATYYGGTETEYSNGITSNRFGEVFVVGWTWSTDFPVTADCYQSTFAGKETDGIIMSFNQYGVLRWATYCGGNSTDHIYGVACDNSGNIGVAGWSESSTVTMNPDAYQPDNYGSADAMIFKFSRDGAMQWGTFFGRDSLDYAQNIKYDNGEFVITGHTRCADFPTTPDAYQKTLNGITNAYIAKFGSISGGLAYSSFFGGNLHDYSYGLAIDKNSNMYITGDTKSTDLPTTSGSFQSSLKGMRDSYLAKFDKRGVLKWCTYLGGTNDDLGVAVTVDNDENVVITGNTYSRDLPTTPGAVIDTLTGNSDIFISKFNKDGSIYWSTYYGGSGEENARGVTTDDYDNVYIGGDSDSKDFPIFYAPIQGRLGGKMDGIIIKLCKSCPNPVISYSGSLNLCKGDSITLDAGSGFKKYVWSTGEETRKITIGRTGTFYVTVWDTNFCLAASKPVKINVFNPPVVKILGTKDICEGDSLFLQTDKNFCTYLWSTGDTTSFISVLKSGKYSVTVTDTNGCFSTASIEVFVNPRPKVQLTGPLSLCAFTKNISYDATQLTAHKYEWSIDNGFIMSGDNTPGIKVNWGTQGRGRLILATTNLTTGCYSMDTLDVILTDTLHPTIKSLTNRYDFCPGDSITLSSENSFDEYLWSTGEKTKTIVVNKAGEYTLSVLDNKGCIGSGSIIVTQNQVPSPAFIGEFNVCENSQYKYFTGKSANLSYLWKSENGVIVGTDKADSVVVNWANPGTGKLQLTIVNNTTGCVGDSSISINITKNPEPKITYQGQAEICEGDSLLISVDKDYNKYIWSTGDSVKSIYVKKAGLYRITVNNQYNCSGTDSMNLIVHQLPANPTIKVNIDTLISSDAVTYQWYSEGKVIAGANIKNYIPIKSGYYTVRISNQYGCSAYSDSIYFDILKPSAVVALRSESLDDTINCKIGTKNKILLYIDQSRDILQAGIKNYTAQISFNSNMMASLDLPVTKINDSRNSIKLNGQIKDSIGKIAEFEMFSAWGDSVCTAICIDSFEFVERKAPIIKKNAGFCLTDLYTKGGTRLFLKTKPSILKQNLPNPFTGETQIDFTLGEKGITKLYICDLFGNTKIELINRELESGDYNINFKNIDLTSGVYFYILQTVSETIVKRMEIVK